MCPSSTTEDGTRGGSRTAATSKMERFVIIVNGWKLEAVNYYHKVLILDIAAVLDPPLVHYRTQIVPGKCRLC